MLTIIKIMLIRFLINVLRKMYCKYKSVAYYISLDSITVAKSSTAAESSTGFHTATVYFKGIGHIG